MSFRHAPKHTGSGLNDDVWNQLEKIADTSRKLAQRVRIPTHPVYDATNFPPNATRGQIVRDINDPNSLWVYGEDDQWHKIGGGGIDYLILNGVSGHYINNGQFHDRGQFDPVFGGTDHSYTNNSNLWGFLYGNYPSAGGNIVAIYPREPGFYVGFYSMVWRDATPLRKAIWMEMAPTFPNSPISRGAGSWTQDTTDDNTSFTFGQTTTGFALAFNESTAIYGNPPVVDIAYAQFIAGASLGNGALLGTPITAYSECMIMRIPLSIIPS